MTNIAGFLIKTAWADCINLALTQADHNILIPLFANLRITTEVT